MVTCIASSWKYRIFGFGYDLGDRCNGEFESLRIILKRKIIETRSNHDIQVFNSLSSPLWFDHNFIFLSHNDIFPRLIPSANVWSEYLTSPPLRYLLSFNSTPCTLPSWFDHNFNLVSDIFLPSIWLHVLYFCDSSKTFDHNFNLLFHSDISLRLIRLYLHDSSKTFHHNHGIKVYKFYLPLLQRYLLSFNPILCTLPLWFDHNRSNHDIKT